jgi:hypothetical protein
MPNLKISKVLDYYKRLRVTSLGHTNLISSSFCTSKPSSYWLKNTVVAMNNRSSSSFIRIIPFPNLEEVVPARGEDLRKMSLKDEPRQGEETGNKMKIVEIKEEEQEQEGDDESTAR